jgi:hypothetical protein
MEVDLVHGDTVDLCLGFRQAGENFESGCFDRAREFAAFNELADLLP